MPVRLLTAAVFACSLPSAAQSPPAAAAPASPAELFAAVAKDTRAQWRPYFRENIPRAAGDRHKAALSLGAVCADCYLAAEIRDSQQLRNLLTDMAALETMLGIARQAASLRQKLTDLAAAGDWPGVRTELASLLASHSAFLAAQKDEPLAELEICGLWLRAMHVAARFSTRQQPLPAQPCIGSTELLESLRVRAARLHAAAPAPALESLLHSLTRLTAVWQGPADARLKATLSELDALMSALIGDIPKS
jgi:hypothetical protein